ncbi:hypothetical protein ABPG75_010846 [Micractinium tetrahymenae]
MKPQEVSNSLWGWSKLGWPFEQLQPAAGAAVAATAADMTPQEVSNVIYAYALGNWPLTGAAQQALRDALPAVLHGGNAQGVATSLWAWSKLGQQLDADLAAVADAALLRTLPHMNVKGVTQLQQAFSTEGWQLSSEAAAALREAAGRVGLSPAAAA